MRALQPKDFLLGGNPRDPLNLASITGPSPAGTPKGSPGGATEPPVPVIIPKSTKDPLNLDTKVKGHKRKRRRSRQGPGLDRSLGSDPEDAANSAHQPSTSADALASPNTAQPNADRLKKPRLSAHARLGKQHLPPLPPPLHKGAYDPIVSPVVPAGRNARFSDHNKPPRIAHDHQRLHCPRGIDQKHHTKPPKSDKAKANAERFRYGNYNQYYGSRLSDGAPDPRLALIRPEWIRDKDVLDIGCNIGHVTALIARDFAPSRIVGTDIDPELVCIARKNIRNYLDRSRFPPSAGSVSASVAAEVESRFPPSFAREYGPLGSAALQTEAGGAYPRNLVFRCENAVPLLDGDLERVAEEWDVVLCLSLTKWVQLNWGDAGLKRLFRRIHRSLRPGGVLFLEPQTWDSYAKKRRVFTPTMHAHFHAIQLKPELFQDFLLHDVGFASATTLADPKQPSGYERPVLAFFKALSPPRQTTSSSNSKPSSTAENKD